MSQTAGFLRLPSDHRLHGSNPQPCGFLTPISPLILYLLAAPGPTRRPVPPQKEPAFLTRRHLQIPWDSGLCLPPSIASQQRRRRERLTPQRWGPAARPSLLQPAKSESPGGWGGGWRGAERARSASHSPRCGDSTVAFQRAPLSSPPPTGTPPPAAPFPPPQASRAGPEDLPGSAREGCLWASLLPTTLGGSPVPAQLLPPLRAVPRAIRCGRRNTWLVWQVKVFPTTDGPEGEAVPSRKPPFPGDQPSPGRT